MNAFERKMAEKVGLISTLVMDINNRADDLFVKMSFAGHVNLLDIDIGPFPHRSGKVKAGDKEFWNLFSMESYLTEIYQDDPPRKHCTLDQMIHVLHQIRQAIIQGRTDESANYSGNDSATATATGLDQRYGTDGELPTEGTEVCYGATVGTGQQQPGALPAMA